MVVHDGQIMLLVEIVSQIATQHAEDIATTFNRGISDKWHLLVKVTAFNLSAKQTEQVEIFRIAQHIVTIHLWDESEPSVARREVGLERKEKFWVFVFKSG